MTYFNDPAMPRFQYPDDNFIESEVICDGCFETLGETTEVEFCETCLCDDDCEGCFYCLCETDYEERKANGTLNY